MIVGDRVLEVEAKVKDREAWKGGRNTNIAITDISDKGDGWTYYKYIFTVTYGKNGAAGFIKIVGELMGKDEPKEILEKWKKDKKVPNAENERLLNTINYVGTAHAVLAARIINYPSPINLPIFRIQATGDKKIETKKK